MTARARAAVVLAAVALVAAGCDRQSPLHGDNGKGGGSGVASAGANGVQQVTLEVGDQSFDYRPPTVFAHPGRIEITLVNSGATPHNISFGTGALAGRRSADATGASRTSLTVTVNTPGTYEFSCTYHASLGMRGQLIVR